MLYTHTNRSVQAHKKMIQDNTALFTDMEIKIHMYITDTRMKGNSSVQ